MRVSFLEWGNGIQIPSYLSFGYYDLLQACFLGKIQRQTIICVDVKYMEHSGPLLSRQEEK